MSFIDYYTANSTIKEISQLVHSYYDQYLREKRIGNVSILHRFTEIPIPDSLLERTVREVVTTRSLETLLDLQSYGISFSIPNGLTREVYQRWKELPFHSKKRLFFLLNHLAPAPEDIVQGYYKDLLLDKDIDCIQEVIRKTKIKPNFSKGDVQEVYRSLDMYTKKYLKSGNIHKSLQIKVQYKDCTTKLCYE